MYDVCVTIFEDLINNFLKKKIISRLGKKIVIDKDKKFHLLMYYLTKKKVL